MKFASKAQDKFKAKLWCVYKKQHKVYGFYERKDYIMANFCQQCGGPLQPGDTVCPACGTVIPGNDPYQQQYQQPPYQQQYQQPGYQPPYPGGVDDRPVKSKLAAGLFGILLGGIGIHKFYMGKIGMGVLYVLFAWCGIPAIIGLIEGILYLCMSDAEFENKFGVRVR